MKRTKELLILAMPLMMVGCNGSSNPFSSSPPPPPGIDAEGIYEGTVANGDSIIGIVAADGTADFLEYPTGAGGLPAATSGAIIVPDAITPDENGSISVPFSTYLSNNFTFPGGDVLASTFSGLATAQSSLTGQYLTTAGGGSVLFNTSYDASTYENGSSMATIAGTYSATYFVGSIADTAQITITATTESVASVDVIETAFGCHYTGQLAIPNPARNAFEIGFASPSQSDCAVAQGLLDDMQGLGALLNSGQMFAILSDQAVGLGIVVIMSKTG
jgi:hypothetical protein